eukprot:s5105_g1.t1
MNQMFSNFGSVNDFFMTFEDRKKLTQKLLENFPEKDPLSPADWSPGVKTISLWQLCFHVESGNKGLVIQEFMRNLVMLMLIQGPRTNALTQAGVEYMILGNAVAEFGIARGPVTHAAISAVNIRVGFQPDLISDDWSVNMRNSEDSVIRTCKRLVMDFKMAPPGLRKSATAAEVARMTRICKAFDLFMAELASQLPGNSFDAEKPVIIGLFEKKVPRST